MVARKRVWGMSPALIVWGTFTFLILAVLVPPLFLIPIAWAIALPIKRARQRRYEAALRIEREREARRMRGY